MLNANQYQSGDYIIAGYIVLYETMHARLSEN